MFVVFTVLIVVTCIFTILIVLVQNSKGGGLASNFSSSNQYMGVRKTADFLEKASWGLAIALLVLSLTATMIVPRSIEDFGAQDTQLREQIEDVNQAAPVDFQAPPPREEE